MMKGSETNFLYESINGFHIPIDDAIICTKSNKSFYVKVITFWNIQPKALYGLMFGHFNVNGKI